MIDLFAGPGGLGEGFSAFQHSSRSPFRIALSIEKNPVAHETLRLRSFFRQFSNGRVPKAYFERLRGDCGDDKLRKDFAARWNAAENEAWHAELGKTPAEDVRLQLKKALRGARRWVLIGGPPCQAYSLIGRSRNRGKKDYEPEGDERHWLYREYLRIIADHWPDVFVMENVKGLLSSKVEGYRLFAQILRDLKRPASALRKPSKHTYRLLGLSSEDTLFTDTPEDFVVRSEEHGIPQARHRIFVVGVRSDLQVERVPSLERRPRLNLGDVLEGLPPLRSGVSTGPDSKAEWLRILHQVRDAPWFTNGCGPRSAVGRAIRNALDSCDPDRFHDRGGEFVPVSTSIRSESLSRWFLDERLGGACNHATRSHIPSDLHRYLFAACWAQVHGRSPVLKNFPEPLYPAHKNASDALQGSNFADRFRVQLHSQPATTITSHIAKDGHYYIHYDPTQCRSLTVREAARAQTFPDNYFFCGPRTEQYGQVGNAVPPLLAVQIAGAVFRILIA